MSFWGLQTLKISQIMMLMQTDRNLFFNENPVCTLPGIYVEIGEKWLMEISAKIWGLWMTNLKKRKKERKEK